MKEMLKRHYILVSAIFVFVLMLIISCFGNTMISKAAQYISYSETGDGYISHSGTSYQSVRQQAQGSAVNNYQTTITVCQGANWGPKTLNSLIYSINRGYLYFHTDSIPDSATILSATLSLYGTSKGENTILVIQNGQPNYPSDNLQLTDYNYNYYSGNGGQFDTTSWSTSGYNDFSITQLSWIQKVGTTKLCLRDDGDISGETPAANHVYGASFWSADGTYKPKLTVNYNRPPNIPSSPSPSNHATGIGINTDLSWTGGDPDSDTVTYDIYFGTSSNPPLITSDYTTTTYDQGPMNFNTKYYWKIVAKDGYTTTTGPIWDFTTASNQAPAKPSTPSGPASGYIGVEYEYQTSTTDPEGQQIYYLFDWGDGTTSGWLGPYSSGAIAKSKHDWDSVGTYDVRVKAKDSLNQESAWSDTLSVTITHHPPTMPDDPYPQDGAVDESIFLGGLDIVRCDVDHPEKLDLTVTCYFDNEKIGECIVEGNQLPYRVEFVLPTELDYDESYLWRVVVNDGYNTPVEGPSWGFDTEPTPGPLVATESKTPPYDEATFKLGSTAGINGYIKGELTVNGGAATTSAKIGKIWEIYDVTYIDNYMVAMPVFDCNVLQCSINDLGWSFGTAQITLSYNLSKNGVQIKTGDMLKKSQQGTSGPDTWNGPTGDSVEYNRIFPDAQLQYFEEGDHLKLEFFMTVDATAITGKVNIVFESWIKEMWIFGYRPDLKADNIQLDPEDPFPGQPMYIKFDIINVGKCPAAASSGWLTWCQLDELAPILSYDYYLAPSDSINVMHGIESWPTGKTHTINIHTDHPDNGLFNEAYEENNYKARTVELVSGFKAGTQITLLNWRTQNIELIQIGDIVLAYDEITMRTMPATVTYLHHYRWEVEPENFVVINHNIKVTINHPLFVNNQWMPAGSVEVGDTLLRILPFMPPGPILVEHILPIFEYVDYYALEVKVENNNQIHNYIANNILVGE